MLTPVLAISPIQILIWNHNSKKATGKARHLAAITTKNPAETAQYGVSNPEDP